MKKYFITFLLLIIFIVPSFSQFISGDWSGELEISGVKLPLVFHIQHTGDTLFATMDSPAQGAKGIKVDKTTFSLNELLMELKSIRATYQGVLSEDSISGTFSQMGMKILLTLKKGQIEINEPNRPQMPKPPFDYNIEDLSFVNQKDRNTLAGTLTTPKNKKNFPVVVMITGSGSQDRDETLMGHKPFWVIADYFTKKGIGVLRMDDRGVGSSSKGKEGATSADFATDIDAAVKFLKGKGYKNIGLVGHSEGGMIAPMVAAQNKDVNFLVLMAGPGIPIVSLMVLQTYWVAKSSGATDQMAKKNAEESKEIYDFMKNYRGVNLQQDLEPFILEALKNSEETKKLTNDQIKMMANQQTKVLSSPWFEYFIKFNPQDNLRKLKIPILAINGSLDVQVTPKENLEGIRLALKKAGNKKSDVIELEGLNHLFQEAKTGAPSEYSQIEQTISPKALEVMTNWILKQKK